MTAPDESSQKDVVEEESPANAYLSVPSPRVDTNDHQQADQALLQRPLLSIRTRIILSFAFIFALCAATTGWTLYTVAHLQTTLHFLELIDSYLSEIQQARRFEKNFLLYGTDLDEAWTHLERAEQILSVNHDAIAALTGEDNLSIVSEHLSNYRSLLQQLAEAPSPEETSRIEGHLRDHGSHMIAFAVELTHKERESVDRTFLLAQRVPFAFLGVLLVLMVVIANFLSRQLLSSLSRFTAYAERIGLGDFSPITPVRKSRDEFSQLALAFNHMVQELNHRHEVLVESHKLRAIGNLVAGVAHELNNPLNNIFLTGASLIEDFPDLDDDEKLDMATDVMQEAERAQHIVRNLLDFARQSETRIEPIHLDEVLRRSVDLVANQVKMSKIVLDLQIPPELPPIHGDSQMLSQVFVNLILNAVDAMVEHGTIQVRVRKDRGEGYLAVEFEDDGPGIPEHVLGRIFEPFYTTKKKGKGTGLGLSVSLGIVKKLGGTIQAKSAVGEGTTFTVLLPTTDIPFRRRQSKPPKGTAKDELDSGELENTDEETTE